MKTNPYLKVAIKFASQAVTAVIVTVLFSLSLIGIGKLLSSFIDARPVEIAMVCGLSVVAMVCGAFLIKKP